MSEIRASLVLVFDISLKDKVDDFIEKNPYKHLLSSEQDDNDISIFMNKKSTDHLSDWLSQTFKIIDYHNFKNFYQSAKQSILHLYLSANARDDNIALNFTGEHILLFWQLGIVLDVDYGVNFDHTI